MSDFVQIKFAKSEISLTTQAAPIVKINLNKVTESSGGGTWGSITGTLALQTDLQAALTNALNEAKKIQLEFKLSDITSSITTGSKGKYQFMSACTIAEIVLTVGTAPTGALLTLDIKRTATSISIFSTKITIDSGEKTSRTAIIPYVLLIAPLTFANNEEIEISIDLVGSIEAGRDGILKLIGTK